MPRRRAGVGTFAQLLPVSRPTVRGRPKIEERTFRMSTAKRTTMNKMNRERDIKEKRALKQERKAEKKLAAAAAAVIEADAPIAAPSV
jgi:hypothetical protein